MRRKLTTPRGPADHGGLGFRPGGLEIAVRILVSVPSAGYSLEPHSNADLELRERKGFGGLVDLVEAITDGHIRAAGRQANAREEFDHRLEATFLRRVDLAIRGAKYGEHLVADLAQIRLVDGPADIDQPRAGSHIGPHGRS